MTCGILTIKSDRSGDDTRDMNRVLTVCPTCAWPILEEFGQCVRCRPLATPETDEKIDCVEDEIARKEIAGQMPSMAVFSETQQVSSAEKRSEQAWREARQAAAQRGLRKRAARWPQLVGSVAIVLAVITVAMLLPDKGKDEATLTTPANDLPWRTVAIDQSATVELPGTAVASTASSDIGTGSRVGAAVPGASVAVTVYRTDFGMRGAGAAAVDVLKARAVDLGDPNPISRIKQNRDRWGDAYDLTVMNGQPIARLRAIVVGPSLFVIETIGSQSTRTTQIFSHIVNSLTP